MALLPNQDDVLQRASLQGYEYRFAHSQPNSTSLTTSSDANAYFTQYGLEANAGSAGDGSVTLDVFSQKAGALDYRGLGTTRIEVVYGIDDTPPLTDSAYVGWNAFEVANRGVYLDLQNGEYVNGEHGRTGATLPSTNEATKLTIEIDTEANEAHFTQSGGVNESVTIAGRALRGENVVHIDSNGGSNSVYVVYARYTFGR